MGPAPPIDSTTPVTTVAFRRIPEVEVGGEQVIVAEPNPAFVHRPARRVSGSSSR